MDISSAGPAESAVFTLVGTFALRGSLGFSPAPGHELRNTVVMLLVTCLFPLAAFLGSSSKRDVVIGACELILLPALLASAWLLPPQYAVLRWTYASFAGLLVLIGAGGLLFLVAKRR